VNNRASFTRDSIGEKNDYTNCRDLSGAKLAELPLDSSHRIDVSKWQCLPAGVDTVQNTRTYLKIADCCRSDKNVE
jgi:hypothetical protein